MVRDFLGWREETYGRKVPQDTEDPLISSQTIHSEDIMLTRLSKVALHRGTEVPTKRVADRKYQTAKRVLKWWQGDHQIIT